MEAALIDALGNSGCDDGRFGSNLVLPRVFRSLFHLRRRVSVGAAALGFGLDIRGSIPHSLSLVLAA